MTDIAGVSSGSFAAAMMAVGMSPRLIREKMLNLNFPSMLGNYTRTLSRDGLPLEQFIRDCIVNTVKDYLKSITLDGKPVLQALAHRLEAREAVFTFEDLTIWQTFSNRFKRLTVTTVENPCGKLKVFNCDLTPNVDIAKACHASSAVPIILAPVSIDGQQYYDGGMYNNIPTEYFDIDKDKNLIPNQKKL